MCIGILFPLSSYETFRRLVLNEFLVFFSHYFQVESRNFVINQRRQQFRIQVGVKIYMYFLICDWCLIVLTRASRHDPGATRVKFYSRMFGFALSFANLTRYARFYTQRDVTCVDLSLCTFCNVFFHNFFRLSFIFVCFKKKSSMLIMNMHNFYEWPIRLDFPPKSLAKDKDVFGGDPFLDVELVWELCMSAGFRLTFTFLLFS